MPPRVNPFITPAGVDQIVAVRDPALRNAQITQCYHELSAALNARTGEHANWCTFATWASKQAGQTIRREDLARAVEHALAGSRATRRAVDDVIVHAQPVSSPRALGAAQRRVWLALNPVGAVDRASDAVAAGNRKVFAEIGREFARFVEGCFADTGFEPANVDAFVAGLTPGEPPEGQRYLQLAFARYYRALFVEDAKTRAELMLLANLEIGLHEQTRLQPEIKAALEAAFEAGADGEDQLTRELVGALFPRGSKRALAEMRQRRALRSLAPLDLAIDRLLRSVRRELRRLITEHLMTLTLGRDVRLRLGADVPGAFPPVLERVESPELLALLGRIDPTPDSLRRSGAADWSKLPQRMHFIADLFRRFHTSPDVFEPPFDAEQVAALKAGRLPGGGL